MVIEQVYKVFGTDLPATRSDYSAIRAKPVSMLTITKAFKNWKTFVVEYNKYAIQQRNKAAKAKVVTKKVVKNNEV